MSDNGIDGTFEMVKESTSFEIDSAGQHTIHKHEKRVSSDGSKFDKLWLGESG